MNLPILPEVDLPEGDWFVKEVYVKEYATNYAKAALAAQQQAEPIKFESNEIMRLADEYAEAANIDIHQHIDEARNKLAAYLGIKEAK